MAEWQLSISEARAQLTHGMGGTGHTQKEIMQEASKIHHAKRKEAAKEYAPK